MTIDRSKFEGRKRLPEEELDWSEGKVPYVGMGGTVGGFGIDRHPVTVVKVADDGKTIWVAEDDYLRVDDNGMSESQTYEYYESELARDENQWSAYTLRKNGRWVREGDKIHGQTVWLGVRNRWHNYSF